MSAIVEDDFVIEYVQTILRQVDGESLAIITVSAKGVRAGFRHVEDTSHDHDVMVDVHATYQAAIGKCKTFKIFTEQRDALDVDIGRIPNREIVDGHRVLGVGFQVIHWIDRDRGTRTSNAIRRNGNGFK